MAVSDSDYPPDWKDDVRMNFLFSTFKEKYVNPEGWDAKMNFWTLLIQRICLKSTCPLINEAILCAKFERKGRQPQCLDVVLDHMLSQNLIVNFSDFSKIESEKGWIGWGFDIVVQKPMRWGFSTVQSLLRWAKKEEKFILLPVVKDLADKVLQRHSLLVKSELVDNIIFLDVFEEQCKDICENINFTLAVMQLQKDCSVHVFEDDGRKVIKFRRSSEIKVNKLSEVDKGVLSLRKARDSLLNDVDRLEDDIKSCTQEIKAMVKAGSKTKAMVLLKRKKRLEACLAKKYVAFDNIEDLLCQLQNSGSEKMVLDAYRTGVQAMKASMKIDLDINKIDETMAEVEEAVDDYSEVQKTLSRPVGADKENLEEFEDELAELLAAEKTPQVIKVSTERPKEREKSPSEIHHEELMRRLEALRGPPEGAPPTKKAAESKRLLA
ncbi:charged multivesicular body protein 7-like [Uloborus diversus]|uniref:charged multivesicular body protein 7-like n=1 Tax=Uloborus diversus TaxID=327109 RepID=UPI00240905DE|nr:charged multivesicular body protein 7-like [Uloborus diversus]